jgi:uncharacterized phiE125 gp8 family phage protein
MPTRLVTPPTAEPVTLAEAKAQCRVDGSDSDTYIEMLITAAREWCELHDWRAYMPQTWELILDAWPSRGAIEIPKPPLQSVASIKYTNRSGVEATLDSGVYLVDTYSEPGWVVLKNDKAWPMVTLREINGVVVRFTGGYASAADVPARIKQAILLLVGHWYENRENSVVGAVNRPIEMGVKALLGIDRAFRF